MTFGEPPARSARGYFAYACEPAIVVRGLALDGCECFLVREDEEALLRRACRFRPTSP